MADRSLPKNGGMTSDGLYLTLSLSNNDRSSIILGLTGGFSTGLTGLTGLTGGFYVSRGGRGLGGGLTLAGFEGPLYLAYHAGPPTFTGERLGRGLLLLVHLLVVLLFSGGEKRGPGGPGPTREPSDSPLNAGL